MEEFPPIADLAADPDAMGRGHLWVLEVVEGSPLRFSLRDDGQLVFGDEHRRLDPDDTDPAIAPAIESVRARFQRDAFREAVADVSAVTFFGVATCQHRLDYDWGRLPPFVGYDVHSPEANGLLSPDAAHASFERLGLAPAPAIERERRADTFDPERYSFPNSDWVDASVAGVVLADKHGWRGRLENPDRPPEPTAEFDGVDEAVETLVTEDILASLGTNDPVAELAKRLAREHRATLASAGIDPAANDFHSAVARVVGRR